MNAEMWEELTNVLEHRINEPECCTTEALAIKGVLQKMLELERHHLPERVAAILEKANTQGTYQAWDNSTASDSTFYDHWLLITTAKALRSGDTTEIEKWEK